MRHIRTFGLLVGLAAVLGMASVAVGEPLTKQQIGRQIERRLSEDAFSNVSVLVQASVVSLSGTVSSLWGKEARVTLAGTVFSEVEEWQAEHIARQTFRVLSVQNSLDIEPNDGEPRVTAVGTPLSSSAMKSTPSWSSPHE